MTIPTDAENYLLSLRDRYYNDKKFHEIVNRLTISLTLTGLSNDDIVRAADMAAVVALDYMERQRNPEA